MISEAQIPPTTSLTVEVVKENTPISTPILKPAQDFSTLQRQLLKAVNTKPAVAAYIQQAKKWEAEGTTLVLWYDSPVALHIVTAERPLLMETLKKLDSPFNSVDIRVMEEKTMETGDLDDFDRQVDLIAQVFRGERIGEKK